MTTQFTLIGLTGYAGAGKDTAADFLVKHCGFSKIAFADDLRAQISGAFSLGLNSKILHENKETPSEYLTLHNCSDDSFVDTVLRINDIHTPEQEEEFIRVELTPRQVMQWWGTEYRRAQKNKLLDRPNAPPHQRYGWHGRARQNCD